MSRYWGGGCVAMAAVAVMTIEARPATAQQTRDGAAVAPHLERARVKKDLYLLEKQQRLQEIDPSEAAKAAEELHRRLDKQIGKRPPPILNIYNTWTHETVVLDRGGKGPFLTADKANRFFRCHFTNEPTDMDQRLFAALLKAAKSFRAERVEIISGYRAPKYNLMLRKKGRGVARNSQHSLGNAIDFRLPGIPTGRLSRWVKRQRLGGVGTYHGSGFVHMDVGKVRYWRGR